MDTRNHQERLSLSEIVAKTLQDGPKCYEPEPRNKDGLRWIRHRFPIKGGISWHEVLHRQMTKTNAFFAKRITGE
ncbi:hypothetical protein KDX14_33155 [Burkholderia cenocepacia]|uniref:hypothetical protein n=1 Tax=Burkholderia cenocepacia TaxID=95486 RepID=UPI001B940BBF|nr:hypothetical protein [Burkholderia cenocepacia]MBR8074375.1 hypothetical protein [Burkholderia cenocepacia]